MTVINNRTNNLNMPLPDAENLLSDDVVRISESLSLTDKNIFESLKRSYLMLGYNLVSGSFEAGAVLNNIKDVILYVENGSVFSWSGSFDASKVVAAGSTPSEPEWVEVNNEILNSKNVQWKDNKSVGYSLDDLQEFTDELFAQAGIVPNGQPDTVGNSQRVDAIKLLEKEASKVTNANGGSVQDFIDTTESELATIQDDITHISSEVAINSTNISNISSSLSVITPEIAILDSRVSTNESEIDALRLGQGSSVFGYATRALMAADLAPPDKSIAYVTNDTTATNNGTYRKSGATGTGSWVQSSSDLASQAYQLSTSSEARVDILEYRADESAQAGVIQADLVSVDEGGLIVSNGNLTWSKGGTANPVLEFNNGVIHEISFTGVANWRYLSVGNIGNQAVFFGIYGGAYGRFQASDGNGNFLSLTSNVTVSPFIGSDIRARFNGSFLEVYQRVAGSNSAYTLILNYDLDSLARPELTPDNRKLGFVNSGKTLSLSNVTYGNTGRFPIVSSTLDVTNTKDALSVSVGTTISNTVGYLAGEVSGHALTQDETSITGSSVVLVDADGNVTVTRNTTTYPTVEVPPFLKSFSFKRKSLIYLLLSVNNARSEATILSLSGGGKGNVFKFTNGTTFTGLGPAPTYNASAPIDFIKQSFVNGKMLIQGKAAGGEYETICDYDYSVSGSDLGIRAFGGVVSADGLLLSSGVIGRDIGSETSSGNWTGKGWACLGDSITAQAKYISPLQSLLGITNVENVAVSGATILNFEARSIPNQIASIVGTPNLITVFGGTNDFGLNKPLGTISDTDDSVSFYGGLNTIAATLTTNYPLTRVFFVTILHRDWQSGGQPSGLVNNNGDTVDDFNDAIKAVGRLYSIPVIDVYQGAGISLNNITTFTFDRLHLNDLGGQRVAEYLASVIEPLKDNV